jgi:hypothetical protein
MALEKFRAAPLPQSPPEYTPEYFRQFTRVLEIYFNQLDSKTPNYAESYRADNFFGGNFFGDGYGLRLPHVAASDSTDQVASGNDTATQVQFDTLESGYEWTLNAPGSATADFPGVYKITYSLQFINSSNAIHFATVWIQVNGSDVANSATKFFIPARKSNTVGEEGYTVGYSEATFSVNAGDEVELYWATDLAGDPTVPTTGVYIFHDAAQTSPFARPAIPSVIGSITFVSALP